MSAASPIPFDARPLTERLSRKQAVRVLAERNLPTPMRAGGRALLILGEIGLIALGLWLTAVLPSTDEDPLFILGLVVALIGLAALAVSIALFVRGDHVRTARLALFAEANAMHYHPSWGSSMYSGMIFTSGTAHTSRDIVRGNTPRIVEFGNHEYEPTDSEKTVRWGYIAVQLETPLPHIVLDATANDRGRRSNLPIVFPEARELALEGDFARHFRLLCPPGYETDALFLFTPDVMARFVDTAAQVDVEIIDGWLFFYLDGRRATGLDPDQWAWMFSLVAAMLEKIDRWARWRDDRLEGSAVPDSAPSLSVVSPPKGVATSGRSMRRRGRIRFWSVVGSVFVGAIALLQLFAWLADTFGS